MSTPKAIPLWSERPSRTDVMKAIGGTYRDLRLGGVAVRLQAGRIYSHCVLKPEEEWKERLKRNPKAKLDRRWRFIPAILPTMRTPDAVYRSGDKLTFERSIKDSSPANLGEFVLFVASAPHPDLSGKHILVTAIPKKSTSAIKAQRKRARGETSGPQPNPRVGLTNPDEAGLRRKVTSDARAPQGARRQATTFHGPAGKSQVVRLTGQDRAAPPAVGLVVGTVESITYRPAPGSRRAAWNWEHKSGDRGQGKAIAREKPLLVVDPRTRRPHLVMNKSPMRFSARKGLVG